MISPVWVTCQPQSIIWLMLHSHWSNVSHCFVCPTLAQCNGGKKLRVCKRGTQVKISGRRGDGSWTGKNGSCSVIYREMVTRACTASTHSDCPALQGTVMNCSLPKEGVASQWQPGQTGLCQAFPFAPDRTPTLWYLVPPPALAAPHYHHFLDFSSTSFHIHATDGLS